VLIIIKAYIDRFGAKAFGAGLAQSRMKDIEKIRARIGDAPPLTGDGKKPTLNIPPAIRGEKLLINIKDVTIGYTSKETNKTVHIVNNVNLKIERGMRVAIQGENGAGKSTLLSTISGRIRECSGEVYRSDRLEMGTFTQDLAQDLDQNARAADSVIASVSVHDSSISMEKVRSALGSLGLTGDKSIRLIKELSGKSS
jgi:ATP-binding cassette subfamily F protein 3